MMALVAAGTLNFKSKRNKKKQKTSFIVHPSTTYADSQTDPINNPSVPLSGRDKKNSTWVCICIRWFKESVLENSNPETSQERALWTELWTNCDCHYEPQESNKQTKNRLIHSEGTLKHFLGVLKAFVHHWTIQNWWEARCLTGARISDQQNQLCNCSECILNSMNADFCGGLFFSFAEFFSVSFVRRKRDNKNNERSHNHHFTSPEAEIQR